MLLSAINIFGTVVRILEHFGNSHQMPARMHCHEDQFKRYQIVVTGHSLGAGVAALLTLLLRSMKCMNARILKII